ncbi:hypothetical protein HGRIS_013037 [Hohenbuehelia grisea]|uniref:Transcription elongation factor 1 homolog n=1 Tax=Hohenbuehelia grisea TaxID=104357 RepID=A0ABR3IUG7_9AGAR
MGKRKKSSRKPGPSRRKEVLGWSSVLFAGYRLIDLLLDTTFTCLFCHHDNSVTVRLDKKEGVAQLMCRICDQRYQSRIHHLTEPIDIYSEWIDAADAAQKEQQGSRRPVASSSRPAAAAVSFGNDEE